MQLGKLLQSCSRAVQREMVLVDFSRRHTDEHGRFSFVSETRKAAEEVSASSFAFPASETNEKLSC